MRYDSDHSSPAQSLAVRNASPTEVPDAESETSVLDLVASDAYGQVHAGWQFIDLYWMPLGEKAHVARYLVTSSAAY